MRLFIAIDLPENVKKILRRVQELLCESETAELGLSHDFHLTLKFLGECDEKKKDEVVAALVKIPFDRFDAELTSVGTFGREIPRVVWAGIAVPASLSRTVKQIELAMRALKFPPEYHFTPHITLARVKNIVDSEAFAQTLELLPLPQMSIRVKNFFLFESRLSGTSAVHTKLQSFPTHEASA